MEGVDEIVREFLVESHENLDQLDSDLVALEGAPGSRELLASIFRTIHTIKGTSGFLAFAGLERVTHAGESLLAELRDGRRTMDQTTTDVLLRMVDSVRALLGAIETTGGEGDVDVTPVVAALEVVLAAAPGAAAPAAAEAAPAEAAPAEAAPAEAAPSDVPADALVGATAPVAAAAAAAPAARTGTKVSARATVKVPAGVAPASRSAVAADVAPAEAAPPPATAADVAPAGAAPGAAPATVRVPRIKRTSAVPRPSAPPASENVPTAPARALRADAPTADVPTDVPADAPADVPTAALAGLGDDEPEWTPTFAFDATAPAPRAGKPPAEAGPTPESGEEGPVETLEATHAEAVEHVPEQAPPTPSAQPAAAPDAAAFRGAADSAIRVDVSVLDALMRQVSELVLARNAIARLAEGDAQLELVRASQRLSLVAGELQEGVMKTRMQPIEHVWSKVPRMVRDLAASCGRQVKLEMSGGDTELDRSLLEAIKDPLTHLVRNAVDHGIEPPSFRVGAGKPATGVLGLRAYHAGGQVVVEVSDDGAGINPDRIGATAVRKGLRTAEQIAAMPPAEILRLLFLPGFSTATSVTNVSGRGVGMDVVRTRIEAIGGTVDVESTVGRGTTWRLRIPLTLAIMPAVLVGCGEQTYALAQSSLLELVAIEDPEHGVEHVHNAPVYRLRGDLLPLVDLREVLGTPARSADGGVVVAVLQTDDARFGLIVDRVLDSEEIVVKPLAAQLKAIGVYAGATLLGDGAVSLILDVSGLVRRAMVVESEIAEIRSDAAVGVAAASDQMLVVGVGHDRRLALPLEAVTRLEKLPAAMVEVVGGREVVQYRGAITPLVRLSRTLGVPAEAADELTVVVATRGERSVALVVSEIVDIVEDDGSTRSDVGGDVLLGSTVLKERTTELLNVRSVLLAADPHFFDDEADVPSAELVGV